VELPEGLFVDRSGANVKVILISEQRVRIEGTEVVHYLQPEPFKVEHCLSYVKMYKHLKR
jgi:hypothetical protein